MAEEKRNIRVELSEEEYKALKEYAERNNLKTKTYTEFLLKNIIKEAKGSKNPASIFEKFKNLF